MVPGLLSLPLLKFAWCMHAAQLSPTELQLQLAGTPELDAAAPAGCRCICEQNICDILCAFQDGLKLLISKPILYGFLVSPEVVSTCKNDHT